MNNPKNSHNLHTRVCVCVWIDMYIFMRVCVYRNICVCVYKVKLMTVVKGDLKAPFPIATTLRCWTQCYSFPWIAPLFPWYVSYIAEYWARRHQVSFFDSFVWLDLGLNRKSPIPLMNTLPTRKMGQYIYIYKSAKTVDHSQISKSEIYLKCPNLENNDISSSTWNWVIIFVCMKRFFFIIQLLDINWNNYEMLIRILLYS